MNGTEIAWAVGFFDGGLGVRQYVPPSIAWTFDVPPPDYAPKLET